jgi:hypothetical protein
VIIIGFTIQTSTFPLFLASIIPPGVKPGVVFRFSAGVAPYIEC